LFGQPELFEQCLRLLGVMKQQARVNGDQLGCGALAVVVGDARDVELLSLVPKVLSELADAL